MTSERGRTIARFSHALNSAISIGKHKVFREDPIISIERRMKTIPVDSSDYGLSTHVFSQENRLIFNAVLSNREEKS